MPIVTANPWDALRRFTRARIALGRAGASLPTAALLEFGLAHAQARDAVHEALDPAALAARFHAEGMVSTVVHSAAASRAQYLRRPDLGRRLDEAGRKALAVLAPAGEADRPDVVFVAADGLSALATVAHAPPLLAALRPLLEGWRIGPLVIARQARVALGDEIGALLGARQVVMLIGERPGLSSPDSLGIYLTHGPRPGLSDADRNCISNVRPQGLGYTAAAHRLAHLLRAARALGRSGIALKDDSAPPALDPGPDGRVSDPDRQA